MRAARAHLFVADLDRPTLDPDDEHHVRRVLRLAAGDAVTVADGAGRWRPARLGGGGEELEPTGPIEVEAQPTPALTVAFAPPKGDRPELAVQKLTELGVDRIVVFVADRSVVRWSGERAAHHQVRLARVARQAGSQCRRCRLPVIETGADFGALVAGAGVAGADPGGGPVSLSHPTVLIGPEGGWSERERAALPAVVGLGPHVLRAETAAITAGAVLASLRAGIVVEAARGPGSESSSAGGGGDSGSRE